MGMLALALLVPLVQETDWAGRLSDPDPAVRDEATARLLEMGDEAVAVLTPLREHADPEIRARAAAILDQIERGRPLREILRCAEPIDLATDSPMPLSELCARLSEHFGVPVTAQAGDLGWSGQLEHVTLLQAADEVARALETAWSVSPDGLRFSAGDPSPFPAAYVGPFKVWVSSVTAERTTQFSGTEVTLRVTLEGLHERQAVTLTPQQIQIDRIELDVGHPIEPTSGDAGGRFVQVAGQAVQVVINQLQGALLGDASGPSATFSFAGVPADARTLRRISGRIRLGVPDGRLEWVFDALGSSTTSSAGPSTGTVMYRRRERNDRMSVNGTVLLQTQGAAAGLTELQQAVNLQEHADFEFEDASGATARLQAALPALGGGIVLQGNTVTLGNAQRGYVQVQFSGAFEDPSFAPTRMRVRLPERLVTEERGFEIGEVPLP